MAVTTPFATVEAAIEDIREGRMVIVVDDEDRENEGDLTIAAQFATPEAINFMATHARGLICLCVLTPRAVAGKLWRHAGRLAGFSARAGFCAGPGLKLIPVAAGAEPRRRNEKLVERGAAVRLPTGFGEFPAVAFREKLNGKTH